MYAAPRGGVKRGRSPQMRPPRGSPRRQEAVDGGLGRESPGVLGGHGAAVEEPQGAAAGQQAPQRDAGGPAVRGARRRGPSRSPRPARRPRRAASRRGRPESVSTWRDEDRRGQRRASRSSARLAEAVDGRQPGLAAPRELLREKRRRPRRRGAAAPSGRRSRSGSRRRRAMPAETSPVNAPSASAATFWQASDQRPRLVARIASAVNGGATTSSRPAIPSPIAAASSCAKAARLRARLVHLPVGDEELHAPVTQLERFDARAAFPPPGTRATRRRPSRRA